AIALVVKRDRLKVQNGFAGLIHRSNLLLEPTRGTSRAKLANGVNQYWYGIRIYGSNATNTGNKSFRMNSWRADSDVVALARNTWVADINIVAARGETLTSSRTQRDV